MGSTAKFSSYNWAPEPTPKLVTSFSTCQILNQFLPSPYLAPEQDGTVWAGEHLWTQLGKLGRRLQWILHTCVHGGTIHSGHRWKQPNCTLMGGGRAKQNVSYTYNGILA